MCGIVGIIGKHKVPFFDRDIKLFTELLHCSQVRGSDGVGVFFDGDKSGVVLRKDIVSPAKWIETKYYNELTDFWGKHSQFVVGHCRAGTRGKNIYKNTHPFNKGHITGVHNGTLFNHRDLAQVENDSEALYTYLSEHTIDETVDEVTGAYALVWHDKKQNTLNLLRNYERPLAIIECNSFFIICSELEMGLWICKRNKELIKDSYELEPNTLATINLQTNTWSWRKVIKTYKPFVYQRPVEKEVDSIIQQSVLALPAVVEERKGSKASVLAFKQKNEDAFRRPKELSYGHIIYAYPTGLNRDGRSVYVDAWSDCYGLCEDLRVNCKSEQEAVEILNSGCFVGRVSAKGYNSKTGAAYSYLSDIKYMIVTGDGQYKGDTISCLPDKCTCCGKFLSLPDLHFRDITTTKINEVDVYETVCLECETKLENTPALGYC